MVNIQRNLLSNFDLIDAFQNRQPMPDTVDAHFLQFIMFERDKCFAHNSVLCKAAVRIATCHIDELTYLGRSHSIGGDRATLETQYIHLLSIPR